MCVCGLSLLLSSRQTSKAADEERKQAADAAAAAAAATAAAEAEAMRLQRSLEKAFAKIAELREARNRAAAAAEAETEMAAALAAQSLNESLTAELEDAEAQRDAVRAALAELKATLSSSVEEDERSSAVLKALLAVRTEQRDELAAQLADAASRHGAGGEEGLAERLSATIYQRDALQERLTRLESAEELLQSSDSFLAEMLSNLKVDRDELAAALLEAQAELRRLEAEAATMAVIVAEHEAESRMVEERAEELAESMSAEATRKYLEERDRANEALAAMWAKQDTVRAEMEAAKASAKAAEEAAEAARQQALLDAENAASAAAERVAEAEAQAAKAAEAAREADARSLDLDEQLARLFLSLANMRNQRDAAVVRYADSHLMLHFPPL